MTRLIALLFGLCCLGFGQSREAHEAFFSEVTTLASRQINGEPIVPASRVQEDLQFSASSADALLTTAREYFAGKAGIERDLKRAIFDRRMQVIAGETVSVPIETELIAASGRRVDAFLAQKLAELKGKVGEAAFQDLARFIDFGSAEGRFFPLRDGEAPVVVARN